MGDGPYSDHKHGGSVEMSILDIVDGESRRVVDFEILQMTIASERGNDQENSNGMEWKWKQ
jgi:hypothetical protein